MKSFLIMGLLILATASQARDAHSSTAGSMQQGREMIREGRVALIREELQLTEDEALVFWPLYDAYRAETEAVLDRYAALITDYVRRYNEADLTDEYADKVIDEYFAIQRDLLGVQESYLPEFRAVLPALKVARFFQLEKKTNAEIDAQLALVVPLMDAS